MGDKKNRKSIHSVAVIGAGFSGLVSSLLLSQAGKEVVIVERDENVAPLLRNCTYEGFDVNNAFQYLGGYYSGGALHASFEQLGINDELTPIAINDPGPDCFLGVIDGELVIPVGLKKVKSVLEDAFSPSESVLSEYFELIEEVFRDFSFLNLKDFFSKTATGLSRVSLKEFLTNRKSGKDLIEFLSIYSEILLGVTAAEVPLLTHLLGVGAYFHSAHTFKGGGGALVTVLERKVREAGVQILTESEVIRLDCDARGTFSSLSIRSVRTGQEFDLHTDACLSTIHPMRLLQLLPEGRPSDLYSRRIVHYCNTKSVCLFHLVLDQNTERKYFRNYHQIHKEKDGAFEHLLAVLPNFLANGNKSNKEQGLSVLIKAWENDTQRGCPGQKKGSCFEGAASFEKQGQQSKPEFLKRIRYNMQSRLESVFPELSSKYRIIKSLSPCDFDRINGSWHGSIYGVKCSVDRMDFTSLGPMKRLSLAGQSVIAPGIYGTLTSAYLAVDRLMRRNA
jgi:all-trans-retinol 13,14-reductase